MSTGFRDRAVSYYAYGEAGTDGGHGSSFTYVKTRRMRRTIASAREAMVAEAARHNVEWVFTAALDVIGIDPSGILKDRDGVYKITGVYPAPQTRELVIHAVGAGPEITSSIAALPVPIIENFAVADGPANLPPAEVFAPIDSIPPHTWSFVGGQLVSSGLALAMRTRDAFTPNARVGVRLVTANLNQGLCLRLVDQTHFWIVLTRNDTGMLQFIRYNTHGALIVPQVPLGGSAIGKLLEVAMYEEQWTIYLDGVRMYQWEEVDPSFGYGTKHGTLVNINTPGPAIFDDLTITPLFEREP